MSHHKPPNLCEVCCRKSSAKCSRCFAAGIPSPSYCSTDCQRQDYKSHKAVCGFVPSVAQQLRYMAIIAEASHELDEAGKKKVTDASAQLFSDWGDGDTSKGVQRVTHFTTSTGPEDMRETCRKVCAKTLLESDKTLSIASLNLNFDDSGELTSTRDEVKEYFTERLLLILPAGFKEDLYTVVVIHFSGLLFISRTAVKRALLEAGLPTVDGKVDAESPNMFRIPPTPGTPPNFLVDMLKQIEIESRSLGNGDIEKGVSYIAGVLFELHDFACFSAAMKDGLHPDDRSREAVTWEPSELFIKCMMEKNAEFGIDPYDDYDDDDEDD